MQVGVLRWDNWRLDELTDQAIADPAYVNRIPYYAWRRPDGSLGFPGDLKNTMRADLEYARAGGVDYFIFGYYLETGSWGRNRQKAKALNRAYRAYADLSDHAGVKFALNFDWSFPVADIPAVSDAIAEAVQRPDYVLASDGAAPVFFFTPNLERWAKGLQGEEGARRALVEIRRRVEQVTKHKLYLVSLLFNIGSGGPLAQRIGFDAVSTYANGLGGGGRAIPYKACMALARQFWGAGEQLGIGFLPTVTMGWDYRPLLARRDENFDRDSNASWCAPGEPREWADQIAAAARAAAADLHNDRFNSLVIYAWNEFSEGGWLSPTVGEGVRRLEVLRAALRRAPVPRSVILSWPRRAPNEALTADWPCPPGLRTKSETDRPAPQNAAYATDALWRTRICD